MSTESDRPAENRAEGLPQFESDGAQPPRAERTAAESPSAEAPATDAPAAGPGAETLPTTPLPPTAPAPGPGAPAAPDAPQAFPAPTAGPGATGPAATGLAPAPAPAPAAQERPRPRTGPIVWGCLILAFCAYAVQRVFAPGEVDTTVWITGTVLALGAILLGVGVAIAIRSARRR